MGIATILGFALQFVQAGFALADIVSKVREMENSGATDTQIHDYLKSLAHEAQVKLEQA